MNTNTKTLTLAVAPFEHYMLADDLRTYPMIFYMRFTLEAELNPQDFNNAVDLALHDHPLLRSHLVGNISATTSRLCWTQAPNEMPRITWDCNVNTLPESPINLKKEIGLRMFIGRNPDATTSILLQLHHSATDAIGATRFMHDVFAAYANVPAQKLKTDVRQLECRTRFGVHGWQWLYRFHHDLTRSLSFFLRKPSPVAQGAPGQTLRISKAVEVDFSEDETKRALHLAKNARVTINDWILAAYFQVLNKQMGSASNKNIRISMPINMRMEQHSLAPAANFVSMAFLTRRQKECVNRDELVKTVSEETAYIKRARIGLTLLRVVSMVGHIPFFMGLMLNAKDCLVTVVFSNLGKVYPENEWHAHQAVRLKKVELLPPLRPATHLAIGAVTYQGRLFLTLHYDQAHIQNAQAEEIAHLLKSRVLD